MDGPSKASLSFVIHATSETFHHWLMDYFARHPVRLHVFTEPTGKGGAIITVGRFTRRLVTLDGKEPPSAPPEVRSDPRRFAAWCFEHNVTNEWDGIEVKLLPLAPERTEVVVSHWPPETALPRLLDDIAERWPECRETLAPFLTPKPPQPARRLASGEPPAEALPPLPKGKGVMIPDYRKRLPREYWDFADKEGCRPTNEELAERLLVSVDTIKRYIRNIRKLGDPWPPPRPPDQP
jgi:hypothetical protein